ncbi:hypothetical protein [Actinoplanes couchii]|uniref:Uncharacterized protein n=1 Tax=Actinoplanes couchii TaxID=403638 RepID=A0ABQ3XLM8_9ACTN|nr:hypothetical protein [Actinoplanes couchii]MDR6318238.1 hypothetical protein [Actinoplanes couchii]GID59391.1 hypothetical protein Aco03nite_077950 [Actinoplanes couchii]
MLRSDRSVPLSTLPVVRRLRGEHGRALLDAVVEDGRINARSAEAFPLPGVVARFAAGSDEAEETLLRTVLTVWEHEERRNTPHHRAWAFRISGVLAVLAETHRGEPERLDRWAEILGVTGRVRLAAAAALLAPLGLAEIDRRCGALDEPGERYDAAPLAGALVEAGRLAEALELAARLQPRARQLALVAVAGLVTDERDARAVVAAFRACPKASRERDQQMIHRHRFARVLLTFGRVDDALSELARMRDCRVGGFGPAVLVTEILRRLADRPELATGDRLRALLDVMMSSHVIHQERIAHVADLLHRAFVFADPDLRTEIIDIRVPLLRETLRSDRAHADAGLAAGLLATGRTGAAMDVLHGIPARRCSLTAALLEVAADAGPDVFAEVFAITAARSVSWPPDSTALAVRLGPVNRAAAARLLDRFVPENAARWADWLAAAAAGTGDFSTLHILMKNADQERTALMIGRRLAAALARHGDPAGARALAEACGLASASGRTAP